MSDVKADATNGTIKRFVVMGGSRHYPLGGFRDYLNSFDAKMDALKFVADWLEDREDHVWGQVADIQTGECWCEQGPFNMTRLIRQESVET